MADAGGEVIAHFRFQSISFQWEIGGGKPFLSFLFLNAYLAISVLLSITSDGIRDYSPFSVSPTIIMSIFALRKDGFSDNSEVFNRGDFYKFSYCPVEKGKD